MDWRERLSKKTIGIAGCGGLGSNAAVALARVGVGNLILVDFDIVEESNLNRQYYFRNQIGKKKSIALADIIHKIDARIKCETFDLKVSKENIKGLFSRCDLIIEAFDKAEEKMMLIETVAEVLPGTPLICGIGMVGWGDNESIFTQRSGKLYVCGDQKTEISEKNPPLAPRVGIVANMQANLALELLLKEKDEDSIK